jgi:hypothetical protein
MSKKINNNTQAGRIYQKRFYRGFSKRLEMEILRSDMRITDARLSDAIDHEEGLRSLHDAAIDRVTLLRSIKRDLQARVDSICSANVKVMAAPLAGATVETEVML